MTKYVLKRLLYMVIVFLLVSLLMYSIYNLIPTDPARAQLEPMKTTLKPAEYEQRYQMLRQQMGLPPASSRQAQHHRWKNRRRGSYRPIRSVPSPTEAVLEAKAFAAPSSKFHCLSLFASCRSPQLVLTAQRSSQEIPAVPLARQEVQATLPLSAPNIRRK